MIQRSMIALLVSWLQRYFHFASLFNRVHKYYNVIELNVIMFHYAILSSKLNQNNTENTHNSKILNALAILKWF